MLWSGMTVACTDWDLRPARASMCAITACAWATDVTASAAAGCTDSHPYATDSGPSRMWSSTTTSPSASSPSAGVVRTGIRTWL